MKTSRGFTLIELLVVVAIIALLAAVIIGSLSGARKKAVDARIKSTMASIRNQAELYYTERGTYANGYPWSYTHNTEAGCNSSYGGIFDSTQPYSAFSLLKDAAYLGGNGSWGNGSGWCFIGQGGKTWAAVAQLRSTKFWCVDSNGMSKELTVSPWSMAFDSNGDIVCP